MRATYIQTSVRILLWPPCIFIFKSILFKVPFTTADEVATFICSSRSLCNNGLYENAMISILHYATVHGCPELQYSFRRKHKKNIAIYTDRMTIHRILFGENSTETMIKAGINSTKNIIIGPESADSDLLYKHTANFVAYDNLVQSMGAVAIVRKKSISVDTVITASISYAKTFLLISLLLALTMALVLWYAVSNLALILKLLRRFHIIN